jgi:Rrf2 family protein
MRETDYALRILRVLRDGARHTAGDLAKNELIPRQFTYKILTKLARAGFVQTTRGADGGFRLSADLDQSTLYDVMTAMDDSSALCACMDRDYPCPWQKAHSGCAIRGRLGEIQRQLDQSLQAHSLRELLDDP